MRHWVRAAVIFWVAMLVAVGVRVALSSPRTQSVVPIYKAAAERWCAGEPLYDDVPGMDKYRNPPGFAAMFAVFALVPEKTAALLWRGFGVAVLLAGLRLFARQALPDANAGDRARYYLAAAPITLLSLNNGQVNVLLTGLLLCAGSAAGARRWWLAGVGLGLAVGLKLYPVAAGLLIVLATSFRLVVPFFVASAAVLALPFACADGGYVAEQYRAMFASLQLDDRHLETLHRAPRDWTIIPRAWTGVVMHRATDEVVSVAAGVAFAAAVLVRRRRNPADALPLAIGLGFLWMTVFGPATENPTYSLLAPVVGWQLALRRRGAVVAFVLVLAPVLRGMFPTSEDWPLRTAQPLGALLLAGMLLRPIIAPAWSAAWGAARRPSRAPSP